ncbi:MAG: OB-fold nucleic acid binding domain-containing protein, partial [Patescibacteria group bacterium]
MATLKEYRNIRIEKLNKLKGLGVNPYPAETHKTHNNNEIVDKFPDLKGKTVSVAGRIISIRTHSKLCFIDLKDASGRLQLYVKEDTMGKPKYENGEISFSDLNLLDTGDFVESTGNVVKTKTGEISVEAKSIRILSKALRPLPDS